jgi:uncharacterized protein YciI
VPTYALIGRDSPRGAELRREHRDAHLRHLEPLETTGRIHYAGPLLDDAERPAGSLVVFEAADLAEAREIAARDPYVRHGIFARYEVVATRKVFPKAEA